MASEFLKRMAQQERAKTGSQNMTLWEAPAASTASTSKAAAGSTKPNLPAIENAQAGTDAAKASAGESVAINTQTEQPAKSDVKASDFLLRKVQEEQKRKDLNEKISALETLRDKLRNETEYDWTDTRQRQAVTARLEEYDAQIEAAKAEKWYYEKGLKYAALSENRDYAELSKKVAEKQTAGLGIGIDTYWWGQGDPLYDYINNIEGARGKLFTANNADQFLRYATMTDKEIGNYNYLYNTGGQDAAKEYLDYLEADLSQRLQNIGAEKTQALAQNAPGLASLLSVPATLLSGVGTLDIAAQNLDKKIRESVTGEYAGPVNYGSNATTLSRFSTNVRETVSQKITDETGVIQLDTEKHPILSRLFNGKGLADVYQLGMSMVDSAAVAGMTALTGVNMTALLGGSASTQTILDSVEKGATDEQALTMGMLSGAFEIIFEKYELENLLGADTNVLKAMANQALTEGIGEGATSVANILADTFVMAESSDWQKNVRAYMAQGLTESEARKQAFLDAVIQIGWDAVGGMAMGGISGGGASAVNNISNTVQKKVQSKANVTAEGKTQNEGGQLAGDTVTEDGQTVSQADSADIGPLQEQARRLSQLVGREVVLYTADATEDGIENGYYEDGKIYINTKGADPLVQIFSHELTHSVEMADVYQELSDVVMGRIAGTGVDIGQLRQQKAALYAQNGVTLKDRSEIDREIVADYVARNLLSDEQSIAELAREKPSLGRRILNWLDSLLAKLGNSNAQERAFLNRARTLYAQALEQSQSSFTGETAKAPAQTQSAQTDAKNPDAKEMRDWMHKEYADEEWTEEEENDFFDLFLETEDLENSAEPAEVRHSISDPKAAGADMDALDRAKQMQAAGVADETIRQDTGWSMGQDGKWHWKTKAAAQTQKNTPSEVEGADEAAEQRSQNTQAETEEESFEEKYGLKLPSPENAAADSYQGQSFSEEESFEEKYGLRLPGPEDTPADLYRGHSLSKDSEVYSYEFLAALPDMQVVSVPDVVDVRNESGRVDTAAVVAAGMQNALSVGTKKAGKVYVENRYTGRQLRVDISSVRHGLNGSMNRLLTNARLGSVIGEVVQNAVPINALHNTAENVEGTYAMAGYATDENGREFVAIVTVEQRSGNVSGVDTYDVTHAVSGRQKRGRRVDTKSQGVYPSTNASKGGSQADTKSQGVNPIKTSSEISIRDFLSVVKDTHQSILSDDVLAHFGDTRNPGGYYTGRAKFSISPSPAQAEPEDWDFKGSIDDDVVGERAYKEGYPVINGIQVIPYRTWVHATDPIKDHDGEIQYDKEGNVRRHNNYGLVTGIVNSRTLLVSFKNKTGKGGKEPGVSKRNAEIDVKDLEPVAAQWQMEREDYESFVNAMPVEMEELGLTDEDMAEIEELRRRAAGEGTQAEAKIREWIPADRDTLPTKAWDYLKRAERKLLSHIGESLSVPRFAQREYLLEIVEAISNEYLQSGTVSEETTSRLFETAYEQGVVVDKEFYAQYKGVKDYLSTTAVTISEQDQGNIANYGDFQVKAARTLRIVNEGGMPVSEVYGKLREAAPELFPDNLVRQADQLQRMHQVSRSIRKAERSLQAYYGEDVELAEDFRRWARRDFGAAIDDVMSELKTVKQYADEQAEKEAQAQKTPMTIDEAMEAYAQLKEARKVYEKARAKNLLTNHAEALVGDLLRGKISLENLDPETDNVKGITAVYEAKKAMEDISKQIAEYKKNLRKQARDKADQYLETANDWNDKKVGLAYSRETMTRNVQDIVPDREVADAVNREYFEPVAVAEAEATRFKEQYRKRVKELGLSRKVQKGNTVSEAHAVQLLGESLDNIKVIENARGRLKTRDGKTLSEWQAVVDNLWLENPGLDRAKIERGVEVFRKIYDELFQQMNRERVANGYEPVNYRKGYFPHFQPGEGDGILAHFGRILGIDTSVVALPTTINGLTHTFKPGIQWFGNAQERLGFNTAYDAVEGFDKYIEGVASVIHQTKNIQNLRALATQTRYRTSDEGIRKQVDAIHETPRLTEEEKQMQIAEIYSHGKYTLSNFVVELDEYTNILANKKSKLDRTVEGLLGRKFYTFMKWWESRVGANMIAGNISSALTNVIPLTQAGAQLDSGSMLRGIWNTLKAIKSDDGIVETSDFLTNRRGSDPLVKTWVQKASAVAGKPMELIDGFVSDSIVRAAYYRNLKQGLSEGEAMHQADIFAAGVMADRSKGAMPTLFASTNPLIKMFTQFQLEVNNQFSEVFKDLPRGFRNKGLKVLAGVLFKYFIGAFLFNDLFEFLFGRRPALDPFGILNDTIGDLSGYEMPNLLELGIGAVTGDIPSFESEQVGFGQAIKNLGGNLLEELPFSSGLTLFGIETDGGRVPASSAVPDLTALWDAATTEGWSTEKRLKEVWDEISKPLTYIVPPFGGNQIAKTWKGLAAYFRGGSYNVDKDGNDILQYPVYKDDTGDAFWNLVRAMIMGKSSLPEAQDWVESGFDSLSAKQTAAYQDMVEAGVRDRDAYALITELQGAAKTEEMSKSEAQREIIRSSDISGEGKAIAYYGMVASDSDRELMDTMADMGAAPGEVADVLMAIADAGALKGAEASCAKRNAIAGAVLTDEEKTAIYREKISESRVDDIEAFRSVGLDFNEFVRVQDQYAKINEMDANATMKATTLAHWADNQDYTEKQKTTVKVSFAYYSQIQATSSKYDKWVEAGMDPDDAYELAGEMGELEPMEGEDEVLDVQRWRTCVDFSGNEGIQLAGLAGQMSASQFAKVQIAHDFGVTPDAYVGYYEIREKFDADQNKSYSNAEVQAAIDAMKSYGLTNAEKAVLWQLATGSKSAKNNPYSTEVGEKVLAAKQAASE